MDNSKVREIADQFGIRVRSSTHAAKGVYQVELDNGKHFALKPMSYPLAHLKWIDSILQNIRKAGLTRIAWRNPHEPEGEKLYVKYRDGRAYVLSPWIWGRWPSPSSPEDMKACGALLAEFHKCGKLSPKHLNRANMLGKWPEELRARHTKLQARIQAAREGQGKDRVSLFLQRYGDELLGYSEQAQSMLQRSQYRQACQLAKQQPHICHGDGGPTNFIITSDGPYLIDFESMRIDLRAYDLYRIIFNSCWTSGWDIATAKAILDGYHEVSPLNRTDLELVCAWLRFPRTTALLVQHYLSRYHGSRASIAAKLPSAIRAERRMAQFLSELRMYLT